MANEFFDSAGGRLLAGTDDLGSDAMTVVLIDTDDDDPNVSSDDFYDDIAAGARVAAGALDSKTTTAGVFDSADEVLGSVTGDVSEEVLLYINTGGADSTDPLYASYDAFSGGMPVTPNGGDITISPNASGWFAVI